MKKFAGVTLEQVQNELLMVARHSTGYRFVGSINEVNDHCEVCGEDDYDYIKDIDFLCKDGQTPSMQNFMDEMEKVERETGEWYSILELFDKFGEEV
jgi:hypothetical protein